LVRGADGVYFLNGFYRLRTDDGQLYRLHKVGDHWIMLDPSGLGSHWLS
jgi:hypothetical protein